MKTLITVMAHKEAQDTFNRHFPLWWNLGHDLLVACPERARVDLPDIRGGTKGRILSMLEIGKAEHHGVQSIVRFKTILQQMNGMGYDRYAFFEYDALCLGDDLPAFNGHIAGPVYHDDNPNRGFLGTMFIHPPILFTAYGLNKVVGEMQSMGLTDEKSVWDRWLGLAVQRSGEPIHNLFTTGDAYTANTIEPAQFPDLFTAIRNGASLVHGIKTPEALKVCLDAAALRKSALHVREHGGEIVWKEKPQYQVS